jgi:hypothetical protein
VVRWVIGELTHGPPYIAGYNTCGLLTRGYFPYTTAGQRGGVFEEVSMDILVPGVATWFIKKPGIGT